MMKRALYVALTVLMLLSMTLIALTGCSEDGSNETTTETATEKATEKATETETTGETDTETTVETVETVETETDTETTVETETSIDLAGKNPDEVLNYAGEKLGTKLSELVAAKLAELQTGKLTLTLPTNLRIDLSGTITSKETANDVAGDALDIAYTGSITLSETGIAAEFTVPNMVKASITCVDNTIYLYSAANGGTATKSKITITDEMVETILGYISGNGSDDETETETGDTAITTPSIPGMTDEDMAQLMSLLAPFMTMKESDIFQSITSVGADNGDVTVTCKGITATFVEAVKTAIKAAYEMSDDANDAWYDLDNGEGETEVPDELDEIMDSIDATKWDDISFSLTVNAEGNIVGATMDVNFTIVEYYAEWGFSDDDILLTVKGTDEELVEALDKLYEKIVAEKGDDINISWTIEEVDGTYVIYDPFAEPILTTLNKYTQAIGVGLKATITRGGQTVTAPADADSYEEMSLFPDDSWDDDWDVDWDDDSDFNWDGDSDFIIGA